MMVNLDIYLTEIEDLGSGKPGETALPLWALVTGMIEIRSF